MHPKNINIKNYSYILPDEKIAAFPLAERDASKLLIFKNGSIQEDIYKNITGYLPENALLVFNNTKVIQARILFTKPTGGIIEIFCLEPYEPIKEYSVIMATQGKLRWKCLIGGAGKWKHGPLNKMVTVNNENILLEARLVEKLSDAYVVELSWEPADMSFAELIAHMGDTPLPPYIKRKAEETDKERYQTIYAKHEGSVAAPTAGLHFTDNIFYSLTEKNITTAYVTLHVGAGTFKPVKADVMEGHEMHAEWIDVPVELIKQLLNNAANPVVAVGTTSVRTLESLYWMGVKIILNKAVSIEDLVIKQWDVYEASLSTTKYSKEDALSALINWMQKNELERLITPTQILIAPGYDYKIIHALITNFHQPQSTLLLLVAAAIGNDWKIIYEYALENNFRFLSYGDGSLLFVSAS